MSFQLTVWALKWGEEKSSTSGSQTLQVHKISPRARSLAYQLIEMTPFFDFDV